MFIEFYMCGFIMFMLGLYIYYFDMSFDLMWDLGIMDYLWINFEIYCDWLSLIFGGVVLIISSLILLYSYWYVDLYLNRFYYMMNLFVLSMIILIFSPNIIGMLLGWDGLGVVSFCLIWFYYGSNESINNSLVTMLYNRFGDCLLIVGIGIFSLSGDMWGFNMNSLVFLFSLLFLLGLSTKSAQFPFSSWLPKAMAAPTPVSSLVHSSTLVTSGLYMLIRYYDSLLSSCGLMEFLGLMTMLIGGTSAFMEFDLKKIIAYSTLSQMGFMIFMLSLGFCFYVYIHMMVHAVFKSMMFMCAGVIIHETGYQDIRCCSGIYLYMPYLVMMFGGSVLSLIGFPFVSGFYSKDVLIESLISLHYSWLKAFMFSLGILITPVYGGRLIYYMVIKGFNSVLFVDFKDKGLVMSVLMLFYGSIYFGSFLFIILFGLTKLYMFNSVINFLVFMYMIVGLGMLIFFLYYNMSGKIMFMYCKFWFLDCLHYFTKNLIINFSLSLNYFDKVWFEIGLGVKSYYYLKYIYNYIFSLDFSLLFYYLFALLCLVILF